MQGPIWLTPPNLYFVAFKWQMLQLLLQLLAIDKNIQQLCLISVYMQYSSFSGGLRVLPPALAGLVVERDRQVPHPHPWGHGVAEKGVWVKRKPIGLYTHPHSLSLDTQGVEEKWEGVKRKPIGLYTQQHSLPHDTEVEGEKRVQHRKQVR